LGRGTNRVIDEYRRVGITHPAFKETHGFLIVTFKTDLTPGIRKGAEKSEEKGKEKRGDELFVFC